MSTSSEEAGEQWRDEIAHMSFSECSQHMQEQMIMMRLNEEQWLVAKIVMSD